MSNHRDESSIGQSPSRDAMRTVLIPGIAAFLASLCGVVARTDSGLSTFWPTTAVLLGLFLRFPPLARPAGWGAAAAGCVAASLIIGDPLGNALLLTSAHLSSLACGCWLFGRSGDCVRQLRQPRAMPVLCKNILAVGAVAGVAGAIIHPTLYQGTALHGAWVWLLREMTADLSILPMILTAPPLHWRWLERRRNLALDFRFRHTAALLALLLSAAAGVFSGGLGALLLPGLALFYCALSYSVFAVSTLTLGLSLWTLLLITIRSIDLSGFGNPMEAAMLIRFGVALAALAPLTLAIAAAARREWTLRLLDIASRDRLTGLLNRHAFRERCNAQLALLNANAQAASLLMINIDHFSAINDHHGAAAGDRVLRDFAARVGEQLRGSDCFGRLGVEEFAILLADCARHDVHAIAERIRAGTAETPVALPDGASLHITVSIGLAHVPAGAPDIEPLLLMADRALYRARKAGHDCVMESGPGEDNAGSKSA